MLGWPSCSLASSIIHCRKSSGLMYAGSGEMRFSAALFRRWMMRGTMMYWACLRALDTLQEYGMKSATMGFAQSGNIRRMMIVRKAFSVYLRAVDSHSSFSHIG